MKEGKYIVYFALTELSDVWFNPKPKTIHMYTSAENALRMLFNDMTVNVKWNFEHIFYEYLLFSTF